MLLMFPHGTSVAWLHRLPDGSFADPVVMAGCAVAPREQSEQPVPSWPPLTSGRTVYAPPGTAVSAKDRVVIGAVTYEVDGDPAVWDNPFSGTRFGVVIQLRRTDDWFDTTVQVRTYLGSGGFGPSWAAPVGWPASVVAVVALNAGATGDESRPSATVRVPPVSGSSAAMAVFTIGSVMIVDAVEVTVTKVAPITRDGFTEYVEVTGE